MECQHIIKWVLCITCICKCTGDQLSPNPPIVTWVSEKETVLQCSSQAPQGEMVYYMGMTCWFNGYTQFTVLYDLRTGLLEKITGLTPLYTPSKLHKIKDMSNNAYFYVRIMPATSSYSFCYCMYYMEGLRYDKFSLSRRLDLFQTFQVQESIDRAFFSCSSRNASTGGKLFAWVFGRSPTGTYPLENRQMIIESISPNGVATEVHSTPLSPTGIQGTVDNQWWMNVYAVMPSTASHLHELDMMSLNANNTLSLKIFDTKPTPKKMINEAVVSVEKPYFKAWTESHSDKTGALYMIAMDRTESVEITIKTTNDLGVLYERCRWTSDLAYDTECTTEEKQGCGQLKTCSENIKCPDYRGETDTDQSPMVYNYGISMRIDLYPDLKSSRVIQVQSITIDRSTNPHTYRSHVPVNVTGPCWKEKARWLEMDSVTSKPAVKGQFATSCVGRQQNVEPLSEGVVVYKNGTVMYKQCNPISTWRGSPNPPTSRVSKEQVCADVGIEWKGELDRCGHPFVLEVIMYDYVSKETDVADAYVRCGQGPTSVDSMRKHSVVYKNGNICNGVKKDENSAEKTISNSKQCKQCTDNMRALFRANADVHIEEPVQSDITKLIVLGCAGAACIFLVALWVYSGI